MRINDILALFIITSLLIGCSDDKLEEKGFAMEQTNPIEDTGIQGDTISSGLVTRPSNIVLTGIPEYRLITVYKVNYDKNKEKSFIGSNAYYQSYLEHTPAEGNAWHYHFMPGLEAVYGYNLVNIAHYTTNTQKQKSLFTSPVLIKTLYYPSFVQDTLHHKPVTREYYMVSVYDEDTNGDKLLNGHDLRRFYHFDLEGENKSPLVPLNYSVLKSEYDPANDFMYVFAQIDENSNGKRDEQEAIHVFWIDLKRPKNNGRLY